MVEKTTFDSLVEKLDIVCLSNQMENEFYFTGYPISMTIKPSQDEQMSLDGEQTPSMSRDAQITFTFRAGDMEIQTRGRFIIDEDVFKKIKTLFAKIHFAFLQKFHREQIDRCEEEQTVRRVYDDGDTKFRKCTHCGAHLDPGEQCDCEVSA